MRKLTIILLAGLLLSGCTGSLDPAAVGEKAREAEEALCPLQTARNLDNAFTNIIRIVPFFNNWQPVCPEETN